MTLLAAELESHLGISEKTLAEFIIELASGKKSIKEFKQALAQNGAEMPDSLVQTIWNVIQRLTQARLQQSGDSLLFLLTDRNLCAILQRV